MILGFDVLIHLTRSIRTKEKKKKKRNRFNMNVDPIIVHYHRHLMIIYLIIDHHQHLIVIMSIKISNMSNQDYVDKQLFPCHWVIIRDISLIRSIGKHWHQIDIPIRNKSLHQDEQPSSQQTSLTIHKQTNHNHNEKLSSPTTPSKSSTYESVKTVKRRIEKLKDQKAAKTLRFFPFFHLFFLVEMFFSSAILIAFIVTWLPYNTNIVISTIKPDAFKHGFPMYWERFGYMLCYINSTIK